MWNFTTWILSDRDLYLPLIDIFLPESDAEDIWYMFLGWHFLDWLLLHICGWLIQQIASVKEYCYSAPLVCWRNTFLLLLFPALTFFPLFPSSHFTTSVFLCQQFSCSMSDFSLLSLIMLCKFFCFNVDMINLLTLIYCQMCSTSFTCYPSFSLH